MRRNFGGGFNKNNNNNFSRNDRRDDRNDRFNSSDNFRKPMNRSFERNSSSDYNKKPRRDYEDNRNAYQDHRRGGNDHHRDARRGNDYGSGSNDRFNDRSSYRRNEDRSRERPGRHHSPMNRGHDSRNFRQTSSHEGSSRRNRMSPPPPPSISSRNQRDKPIGIKSRLNPPLRNTALARSRIARPTTSRILRRNDLRTGLIAKRSAPVNRAKDYAKKIRQARLKLNEKNDGESSRRSTSSSKMKSRERSTRKESESGKAEDVEEDYLAIANDVNFDEDENEPTTSAKAKAAKEKSSKEGDEKEEKDLKDESKEEGKEATKSSRHRSPSVDIDYICIHCDMHLSTAQDYRNHLTRRTHLLAMRRVVLKIRMTLNHLRKVQRDRQLEIEARIEDVEQITSKYCTICKLNFRQTKDEHRESEDHKKIRNFLKPFCKICQTQLASPMKYESHRCSLEHMRRKQKNSDLTDDEIDPQELDIGDFKTVDSVGDVDDEKDDEVMNESASQQNDDSEDEIKKSIGRECIAKVEVNYCSACREYLPRRSNEEAAIIDHCKLRRHLNWYQKFKRENERKAKSAESGKAAKSPEKAASTSKQNGSEEKKEIKEEKLNTSDDKSEKEEKEENSKFKRYDENNDE